MLKIPQNHFTERGYTIKDVEKILSQQLIRENLQKEMSMFFFQIGSTHTGITIGPGKIIIPKRSRNTVKIVNKMLLSVSISDYIGKYFEIFMQYDDTLKNMPLHDRICFSIEVFVSIYNGQNSGENLKIEFQDGMKYITEFSKNSIKNIHNFHIENDDFQIKKKTGGNKQSNGDINIHKKEYHPQVLSFKSDFIPLYREITSFLLEENTIGSVDKKDKNYIIIDPVALVNLNSDTLKVIIESSELNVDNNISYEDILIEFIAYIISKTVSTINNPLVILPPYKLINILLNEAKDNEEMNPETNERETDTESIKEDVSQPKKELILNAFSYLRDINPTIMTMGF